ncbi:MAG: AAA family ATPase [Desulfurellaceae bacterium]|nr:AAA family ATPase [Desulfurellaceae bacterium]
MSTELSGKDLHLSSLAIIGFRGIEDLSIPRLGRVTLFVGKNGVGKTTLLEAVRLYAARGHDSLFANILRNREEMADTVDEDGDKRLAPDWEALFHGRHASSDACISIGPIIRTEQLYIRTIPLSEKIAKALGKLTSGHSSGEDVKVLRVEFNGATQEYPMSESPTEQALLRALTKFFDDEPQLLPEILCESLGPSLLTNMDMARFWDGIALTNDETRVVQALNLIFGDIVDRIAVVGDDRKNSTPHGCRAVVRIRGRDRPVPLKSLGDGAVRLFSVALALANSRDGFLVIDEAENGLYYAVQRDFWKMVLRTACENNVQVFATTHSWDCAAGFAQAAADVDEVEGMLIRLEREGSRIRAVEYSEADLKIAAEQGIEVR